MPTAPAGADPANTNSSEPADSARSGSDSGADSAGSAAHGDAGDPSPALLARWRSDTPGTGACVHLNSAGASLVPTAVLDAVQGHLRREAEIGGYEAADEAAGRIEQVYADLAAILGAAPANLALVESATRGVELALGAIPFRPGDRIVTSRCDYPSNQIMYMAMGERFGVETVLAGDLPEGGIDPASVRALAADPRCKLVSLTWVPTNSGLVQAAQEVGDVCAAAGVPFLVDACQCIGQLPIDVGRLRCDFLTASARKFLRGPRGIGFLYVSAAALERGLHPLMPDTRGATWTEPRAYRLADGARRFEQWELPYALVLGMGAAARYAAAVGDAGFRRAWRLAAALRTRLAALPRARLLDRGAERCAIATAAIDGCDAYDLKVRLRERGINTSAAGRSNGVLDMDAKRATTLLRMSPHYFNTEQELDTLVDALAEVIAIVDLAAARRRSPASLTASP
jgi:selenocysteine lyase/cysteine desulfurase